MKVKANLFRASAVSALLLSASAQERPVVTSEGSISPSKRLLQARADSQTNGLAKASDILGMAVRNQANEKIGKVENLAIDLSSGRVVAVIVSSGGFLGLGDELSAVPATSLRLMNGHEALQLDTTKEALAQAPHFKSTEWPDFNQPAFASGVAQTYQADSASSINAPADPDNTARNVRDRADRSLTPADQSNSKEDVATTAQIRREITKTKGMSTNARNVKIITAQGRVTLRGPVNTEDEKRLIREIAERVAPSANVDDQLEVKSSNTPATGKNE